MSAESPVLGWASRGVWLVCIGVYLMVFVGGIRAGGDDLLVMARAVGLTLIAALLGRTALGLLSQATLPTDQGRSADQDGTIGSLADLLGSANVATQEDAA